MKITERMVEQLEQKITTGLMNRLGIASVVVHCVPANEKVFCIYTGHGEISIDDELKKVNAKLISEISELNWKDDDDGAIYLDSGYIVFHYETDDYVLREYNEIQGDEFVNPVLYVNGSEYTCNSIAKCDCPAHYEFDLKHDTILFEREIDLTL